MSAMIHDRLRIRRSGTHSRQRALLDAPLPARHSVIAAGPTYFASISRLLVFASQRRPDGSYAIYLRGTTLVLLHFTAPYLARSGRGYALRYSIRGGFMARRSASYLAFSARPRGTHRSELRIDVVGFRSRLGSGWLYRNTQARLHSLVTIGFMRTWVDHALNVAPVAERRR